MRKWRIDRHNSPEYHGGCTSRACTWWTAHRFDPDTGNKQHRNFHTHERALAFIASENGAPR